MIEILKLFEVFSELVSSDKKITMNDVVSQLYIIRTEIMKIQQKHFRDPLAREIMDCLLLGLEERGVGSQETGCSEFAIAYFLDPHDKGFVLR